MKTNLWLLLGALFSPALMCETNQLLQTALQLHAQQTAKAESKQATCDTPCADCAAPTPATPAKSPASSGKSNSAEKPQPKRRARPEYLFL